MTNILQSEQFQKSLSKIKDKQFETMIQSIIKQLAINGKKLKAPKCKYLQDGIWELKLYNKNHESRILFFYAFEENSADDEYAVIVMLIKKQKDNYSKEIEYVKNYRQDFYNAYSNKKELEKML
ncbi:type II toxin-antitoxin system RelE/ParE family toxin [uncultured Brachyspira sp.]|uniref:type II toxin-antitoxin system RelE/ParE family toxin n=1 Tax=uncultured Brachyspira sp. TaxID=221953 RepID=UPI00258BD0FB|nr:type II toxin-antitoxin system RelE/ParE family toxin [uncultured Brachyspira sp.]